MLCTYNVDAFHLYIVWWIWTAKDEMILRGQSAPFPILFVMLSDQFFVTVQHGAGCRPPMKPHTQLLVDDDVTKWRQERWISLLLPPRKTLKMSCCCWLRWMVWLGLFTRTRALCICYLCLCVFVSGVILLFGKRKTLSSCFRSMSCYEIQISNITHVLTKTTLVSTSGINVGGFTAYYDE